MTVTYNNDGKTAYFDGRKFRRDAKTGYYLATKPTHNGKRERLHCYVWRYYNGKIPDGYHVHHKDEDKAHNDINNLACLPGKTHVTIHARENAENNREWLAKNLEQNARPMASEWHRSKEGRAWHSEQARKNAQNMQPKRYVCENCGKEFYKKPLGENKYCSGNCKAAVRRKSGVDDETRICAICGREFRVNKYAPTKTCSRGCAAILRHPKNRKMRAMSDLQYGG